MREKRIAWLAWTLFGLVALSGISSVAVRLANSGSINPLTLADDLLYLAGETILFAGVGALIVSRQPRNTVGWLLMTPAVIASIVGPIEAYIPTVVADPPPATALWLLLVWFESWSWILRLFPLLLIALLFPTGRPPSPRWRWLTVATLLWAALFVAIISFAQMIASNTTPAVIYANPIGVFDIALLEQYILPYVAGLLVLTALCVAALFVRFRRADAVERQQIKWLLYVCAVYVAFTVVGFGAGIADSETLVGGVYHVLVALAVLAIPVAIGIAILRYRLFDIDIIIRRTLVYAVLTLLLGATYLAGVALLQTLFVRLTGQESALAVVVSTLGIAALFGPLRRRVQAMIDRRFFRRKYDSRQVLEQFAVRAQQQADLDALAGDMLDVVHETVQPEQARIWLVPSRGARQ